MLIPSVATPGKPLSSLFGPDQNSLFFGVVRFLFT